MAFTFCGGYGGIGETIGLNAIARNPPQMWKRNAVKFLRFCSSLERFNQFTKIPSNLIHLRTTFHLLSPDLVKRSTPPVSLCRLFRRRSLCVVPLSPSLSRVDIRVSPGSHAS